MNIRDTRKCNVMNLQSVARYLGIAPARLMGYYEELLADRAFLEDINRCISDVRQKWGFEKGIFRRARVSSIDWFAFERVLIYVLVRHLRPEMILETGVYYGGNSAFALLALKRNRRGRMVSVDYPDSEIRRRQKGASRHSLVGDSEFYNSSLRPGFIVPASLHARWELIEGDSLRVIPKLVQKFDFYIHDSDHSMGFLSRELATAWEKLSPDALILVDDVDWSNAFSAFCVKHRLHSLLLTDNGKDDLRVRTGIVARGHIRNGDVAFT